MPGHRRTPSTTQLGETFVSDLLKHHLRSPHYIFIYFSIFLISLLVLLNSINAKNNNPDDKSVEGAYGFSIAVFALVFIFGPVTYILKR